MVYKTYTATTNKNIEKPKLQNKNELSQTTLTKGPTNLENQKELEEHHLYTPLLPTKDNK